MEVFIYTANAQHIGSKEGAIMNIDGGVGENDTLVMSAGYHYAVRVYEKTA
jgi:hypothetical protein